MGIPSGEETRSLQDLLGGSITLRNSIPTITLHPLQFSQRFFINHSSPHIYILVTSNLLENKIELVCSVSKGPLPLITKPAENDDQSFKYKSALSLTSYTTTKKTGLKKFKKEKTGFFLLIYLLTYRLGFLCIHREDPPL